MNHQMDVACLLFDGLTALDLVGPCEVLGRLPNANMIFAAREAGPIRADNGNLGLVADVALREAPRADLLLVPGGFGASAAAHDPDIVAWVRDRHAEAQRTVSVCTGALVLGAAGVLEGRRATTHWTFLEQLSDYGALPTAERVVVDGSVWTAAGVSAGIDLALRLLADLTDLDHAESVQLSIEYDPQPPFDAGSPARARPAVRDRVLARVRRKTAEAAGQA